MLQIDVKQLVAAVKEATAFTLPELNAGTTYLYSNLYERLAQGMEVNLSSLDMTAFDLDDVTALKDLYTDVFEANNYAASGLASTLRQIAPVCKATAVNYV